MQAALTHHASPRFWQCYSALPLATQKLADENFDLLKRNARQPSLQFKQIGKLWSVRVGVRYRALGVAATDQNSIVWFWIGSHSDYDRLIK